MMNFPSRVRCYVRGDGLVCLLLLALLLQDKSYSSSYAFSGRSLNLAGKNLQSIHSQNGIDQNNKQCCVCFRHFRSSRIFQTNNDDEDDIMSSSSKRSQQEEQGGGEDSNDMKKSEETRKKHVVVIGAGWGGLSAAYALSSSSSGSYDITVIDASPRVGGLVRDGFTSMNGKRKAEAGQHGFWDQYYNIFRLLRHDLNIIDDVLTDYAEQGQYSPNGLEAIWPVYRKQDQQLPTGLAQAVYTKFLNLPIVDRISAFPLVLAFSEFDDSKEAWEKYDNVSFYDLCMRLGVSRRCYEEAFEPMILTGLFAPGNQCSAAAALGMAYFFVLSNQKAFDVRWCKGNIGERIFDPWIERMASTSSNNPVNFMTSTRVVGFGISNKDNNSMNNEAGEARISKLRCLTTENDTTTESTLDNIDEVVFAVGASALNAMVTKSPELSTFSEFRRFANLRGTSVLATRLFLDREVKTPYTANACWGFDHGVGMTFFNIRGLHGEYYSSSDLNDDYDDDDDTNSNDSKAGSVIEVDYYHANSLLVMNDEQISKKAKKDLDTMLGDTCTEANVVDAAIVRLPNAVNWYFPGSYKDMPSTKSSSLSNVYFAGDLVKTRHGSWSQEKAFVTGMEAANLIQGKEKLAGVIPLPNDEVHVAFGRSSVSTFQSLLGLGDKSRAPSLVDFLF